MTPLKEGDKAPYFEGINQDGKKITLDDFKGKKLILYFYPKDNTSGCTAEACSLNDSYSSLTEKGFEVVGVSPDSANSHLKFIAKYNLTFNLIADTEKKILEAYGVWAEKTPRIMQSRSWNNLKSKIQNLKSINYGKHRNQSRQVKSTSTYP